MLEWNNDEDAYLINLQTGKAVIKEMKQGAKTIYVPSIEDNRGLNIASFEPGFEDFETADAFVDANLIELDRIDLSQEAFLDKLTSTLDYCISLLIEPSRIFHRRRLENIKSWLTHQPANYHTDDLPKTNWMNYVFDWHTEDNLYQAEVPSHGTVSIISRNTTNYYIQIEDLTGVQLADLYSPFIDFASAEVRLRTTLKELENPFVDESYLDYLSFTLQICQHLLPSESDLMQYVRLQYIETYLGEALP